MAPLLHAPALARRTLTWPLTILLAVGALLTLAGQVACNDSDGSTTARVHEVLPATQLPEPAPRAHRGLFVKMPGSEEYNFVPWRSEETFNGIARKARDKPGLHIHFAPGEYEIHQRLVLHIIPDAHISGTPGTRLVFADGPDIVGHTTKEIEEGDTFIHVNHPERLKPRRRYQLYRSDSTGDRRLEIAVKAIDGDRIELSKPVRFFKHVKAAGLPAGLQIMEELNFFHVLSCPNLLIENLVMDGRDRGNIRGHTIYCGIYASGMHHGDEKPAVVGFHVRGCTFRNLQGRGVVFYGMSGALIEHNMFENIRAQAIEIDHISSGVIRSNYVNHAETGVMVNDAFDSLVEGNVLMNCGNGVRFLKIYKQTWVNMHNTIRGNRIGPGCDIGVEFSNDGMTENLVTGNTFIGMRDADRVTNGANNTIEF